MNLLDKYAYLLDEALTGSDIVTSTQIKGEIGKEPHIKKNEIKFKPFKARGLQQRPRLFMESLAGHCLMATAAGYKGLLITIDEFEVHSMLSPALFIKAQNIINYMVEYINEKTDLPQAPLALCFATIGQDSHTGDRMIEYMINNCAGKRYLLKPWREEQQMEMAQRIYSLYSETYGINEDFDPDLTRQVENLLESKGFEDTERVRIFIKWYMALLDMAFGPGRHRH